MIPCWVCRLGLIPYQEATALQRRLVELRFQDRIDDIVLLLEHPPTITLGRFGQAGNILHPSAELEQRGIEVCQSDRGGDVTFHCPGQLVLYPIINLRARGSELRRYLYNLEEVALSALAGYGISAARWSEHPGIWVEGRQIGAIGLRFSRGISMHGLALNVSPDLESFKVINLCGLPGKAATSMTQLLRRDIKLEDVAQAVEEAFSAIFEVELETISAEQVLVDSLAAEPASLV
ncbi:MAG: lipoyl(octanoyl) transferase [Chloroflexi bacterium RBG_16_48_7]|nr:MAG: lipoyl(octanoyl) transferase [Chloroflexi bacterium RBG_16_48_7]